MNIRQNTDGAVMTLSLEGELDHHGALETAGELKRLVETALPPKVRLDMAAVPFMDSSGIAVVMGTYKSASGIGSKFEVTGLSPQPMKVLKAAGIDKMLALFGRE